MTFYPLQKPFAFQKRQENGENRENRFLQVILPIYRKLNYRKTVRSLILCFAISCVVVVLFLRKLRKTSRLQAFRLTKDMRNIDFLIFSAVLLAKTQGKTTRSLLIHHFISLVSDNQFSTESNQPRSLRALTTMKTFKKINYSIFFC